MVRLFPSLLLAVAAAGLLSAAPRPVVVNADWVEKPSGEAVNRAYPKAALAADVSGRAVIGCTVKVDGTLADCSLVSEEPKGLGFGAAALTLTDQMRMRPRTVNGVAQDSPVRIPLSFTAREGASPLSRISWEQRQSCVGEVMAQADAKSLAWPPGEETVWYELYVSGALREKSLSAAETLKGLRASLAAAGQGRIARVRDMAQSQCQGLLERGQ